MNEMFEVGAYFLKSACAGWGANAAHPPAVGWGDQSCVADASCSEVCAKRFLLDDASAGTQAGMYQNILAQPDLAWSPLGFDKLNQRSSCAWSVTTGIPIESISFGVVATSFFGIAQKAVDVGAQNCADDRGNPEHP